MADDDRSEFQKRMDGPPIGMNPDGTFNVFDPRDIDIKAERKAYDAALEAGPEEFKRYIRERNLRERALRKG